MPTLAALTVSLLLGAAPAASADPSTGEDGIDTGLTRTVQGAAGARALGDALPDVAEAAGLTSSQLRGVLATDSTAAVDPSGRLAFREEIPTAPAQVNGLTADAAATPFPLSKTLTLHSLPGSTHTIYLDFDGVTVSPTNAWHTQEGVQARSYVGWDPAGNGPAFTDAELAGIQEIWARVAEDYAAFDVDVTTADPGQAALSAATDSDPAFGTHVVVTDATGPASAICDGQCGGVAWTGLINSGVGHWGGAADVNEIAWVFPGQLLDMTQSIAEAAAHEAGHTFGLVHDGDSATGDSYYAPDDGAGARVWAPIMGAGYYNTVTQWSKGDYPNAHNWDSDAQGNDVEIGKQDDVGIIRSIAGTRSVTASSIAAPLALDPLSPPVTRYIVRRTQTDTYALGTCADNATVSAAAALVGPDLDLALSVVDADGVPVPGTAAGTNPTTTQSDSADPDPWSPPYLVETPAGLGATTTVPAGGGPYFAVVDGGGNLGGAWADGGYDDYASLGAYTLSVTGCDGSYTAPPPEAPGAVTGLAATASAVEHSITATWQPPTTGGAPASYQVELSNGVTTVTAPALDATQHTYTFPELTPGDYTVTVTAKNGGGSAAASRAVTLAPVAVPGAVSSLAATAVPARHTVTVAWSAPTTGDPVVDYQVELTSGATTITSATLAPTVRSYTFTGLAPASYTATVSGTNDGGTASASIGVTLPTYVVPRAPGRVGAALRPGKRGGKKTVVATWRPGASGTSPTTAYVVTVYTLKHGRVVGVRHLTRAASQRRLELRLKVARMVTYAVAVQAQNAVGLGPASARTRAVTPK